MSSQKRYRVGVLACVAIGGVLATPLIAQPCLLNMGKQVASDGQSFAQYGNDVAISEFYMIVGAPGRNTGIAGSRGGAVYTYRPNGVGGWFDEQIIVPDDNMERDAFGSSVALSGNDIVIGAPDADPNGDDSGAAYVYRRNQAGDWLFRGKLSIIGEVADGANFGRSVAIENDVIVVGASGDDEFGVFTGAVFVFRYNGAQWEQEAKLVAPDAEAFDWFGHDVAISGDSILVGSHEFGQFGNSTGSAFVFRYNGVDWIEEAQLFASDGDDLDAFGGNVLIHDDLVVVGARGDDDNGQAAGAAYVFRHNGIGWEQETKLLATNGVASGAFGTGLAMSGQTLYIAAASDDEMNGGLVYGFVYRDGEWVQELQITPPNDNPDVWFGYSIAAADTWLAIGDRGDTTNGNLTGAVHIANMNLEFCAADLNNDCNLNFFDVSLFLQHYMFMNPNGDFNNDGLFNFFDVSDFLAAFSAGCP